LLSGELFVPPEISGLRKKILSLCTQSHVTTYRLRNFLAPVPPD
jgi:hypothetical protein